MLEVRNNGKTQLIVRGDNPIQGLVLRTMLEAAKKGTPLKITEGDQEAMVVTLEERQ